MAPRNPALPLDAGRWSQEPGPTWEQRSRYRLYARQQRAGPDYTEDPGNRDQHAQRFQRRATSGNLRAPESRVSNIVRELNERDTHPNASPDTGVPNSRVHRFRMSRENDRRGR